MNFFRLHVPDFKDYSRSKQSQEAAYCITMDDIFTQCREGNSVAVRLWLDNTENDLNLGWANISAYSSFKEMALWRWLQWGLYLLSTLMGRVWYDVWGDSARVRVCVCSQSYPWHIRPGQIVSIMCFPCCSTHAATAEHHPALLIPVEFFSPQSSWISLRMMSSPKSCVYKKQWVILGGHPKWLRWCNQKVIVH